MKPETIRVRKIHRVREDGTRTAAAKRRTMERKMQRRMVHNRLPNKTKPKA